MYSFILLICLGVTSAQIPSLGFCPEYVPVADFDMNRFLGKWYEAERYFTVSEVASRCVTTEYSKGPSGKIYVSNEVTSRLTSIKRVIDGVIDLSGKIGEGALTVKYNSFPPYDTNYKILDTDYDTYAVMWSCSGIGPVNTQNAWVYTRNRNPSVATLQSAYGVLDKFKISRTFFLKTDQKDCALGGAIEESAATSTTTTKKPKPEVEPEKETEATPEARQLEQDIQEPIKEAVQIAEHIFKQIDVNVGKKEIPVEILKDDIGKKETNAENRIQK